MSRCCGFVVDSTTNPQQIETVEYGFRLVHNKSKSCTTNPQQIHNFTTSRTTCCTTNPQQIEQVEFELLFINRMNKYKLGLLKVINLCRVANKRWVTKAELIQQS
jgi:hypothetical protein